MVGNDVLLIRDEEFLKLSDERYLSVLASAKREAGISRSYYYYILRRLNSLGLIRDKAITFKAVFSYTADESGNIRLTDNLLLVTEGYLVYRYADSDAYRCRDCPELELCVSRLKSVARELGAKLRSPNPSTAWYELVGELKTRFLSSVTLLRAPSDHSEPTCLEKARGRKDRRDLFKEGKAAHGSVLTPGIS
ncbi:MAG: hypothetical protein ACP5HQ_07730 [Thermoprotei archaeon]